jgi:hypothetical protein
MIAPMRGCPASLGPFAKKVKIDQKRVEFEAICTRLVLEFVWHIGPFERPAEPADMLMQGGPNLIVRPPLPQLLDERIHEDRPADIE